MENSLLLCVLILKHIKFQLCLTRHVETLFVTFGNKTAHISLLQNYNSHAVGIDTASEIFTPFVEI